MSSVISSVKLNDHVSLTQLTLQPEHGNFFSTFSHALFLLSNFWLFDWFLFVHMLPLNGFSIIIGKKWGESTMRKKKSKYLW